MIRFKIGIYTPIIALVLLLTCKSRYATLLTIKNIQKADIIAPLQGAFFLPFFGYICFSTQTIHTKEVKKIEKQTCNTTKTKA